MAAAALGAAVTASKMQVPNLSAKSGFENWEFKMNGKANACDARAQVQTLLEAPADGNGEYPQIADAVPPLNAGNTQKWNTLQSTFRDALSGDAAELVQNANDPDITLLDGWRILREEFGTEDEIDKGELYASVASGSYDVAKSGDFTKWINAKYSDCLKLADRIPDPNSALMHVMRKNLGPSLESVMAKLRFRDDLNWRQAKKIVKDFIKSGQGNKTETQATALLSAVQKEVKELRKQQAEIYNTIQADAYNTFSYAKGYGKGGYGKSGKTGKGKKGKGRNKGYQNVYRPPQTCWHCGKTGHQMKNCWAAGQGGGDAGTAKGKGKGKGGKKW